MSWSISTTPSSRCQVAPAGQTSMHEGLSQWLQSLGRKARRVSGKVPISTSGTQVRKWYSGTSFSILQAAVQAWQPTHLRRSMSIAQRLPFCPR